MAKINVFSASAGSGKTYTLARQVIDLLIADPRSYAHILAVTFTNKATGEMKERIVGDLDIMANGADSDPAREALLQTHIAMSKRRGDACATREQVIDRSKQALSNILLDYGQFSVSTIDSFVQRIIRTFAYEQGLPSNYGVQLDVEPVITGAVDELMESLSDDDRLRNLVLEMTDEAIDGDKSWGSAESKITELAKELLSESVTVSPELFEAGNITLLRKGMRAREEAGLKATYDLLAEIKSLYAACGVSDLSGSYKYFVSLVTEPMPAFDFTTQEARNATFEFVSKKAKKVLEIKDLNKLAKKETKGRVEEFIGGVSAIRDRIPEALAPYYTAQSVLKHMHVLGVVGKLTQLLGGVAEQNNKINMSGSGKLLSDLIDSCPVPFVYEKVGVRYDTIMIDEFQDTSRTQYANFRPLLSESLAEGYDCLLVGDVKQSIYRFRGGDWQLLGKRVADDFNPDVRQIPLADNYRSKSQIVNFNNALFRVLPAVMDRALYSASLRSADGSANLLEVMYAGAEQNPKKGDNGCARLTIVSVDKDDKEAKDAAELYVENAYVADLKAALDNGYSFSDICILVRNKKEACAAIERIGRETWHGEPIPVMSDEALSVMSSDATICITDVMHYLSTGERGNLFSALRTLRGETVQDLGQKFVGSKDQGAELDNLRGLGILELVGAVVNMMPKQLRDEDSLYIDAFREQVMEAVKEGEADLGSFLRRVKESGDKWKVCGTSSRPAVKLMTIHKSKGLEFKVVIMPAADWSLEVGAGKNTIWCPSDRLEIDSWRGATIPLTFNSELSKSEFAPDYMAEREQLFADSLNVAYVAFTRPKDVLYAYGVYCPTKDEAEGKVDDSKVVAPGTIVKYLSAALSDMNSAGLVSSRNITVDDNGAEVPDASHSLSITQYSDGSLTPQTSTSEQPVVAQLNVETPTFTDPVGRFKINAEAESRIIDDAADAESHRALMISTGLTNHGILENVRSLSDLHSAVRRAVLNGVLSEADATAREDEMRRRIESDPVVAEWFDAAKVQKVWTETSMVGPAAPGSSVMPFVKRRPDRVMRMADGRTVLVDYKFGKRSPKHHAQVKEYVTWLNYAGFERVEAYLWYYGEGSVERVAL